MAACCLTRLSPPPQTSHHTRRAYGHSWSERCNPFSPTHCTVTGGTSPRWTGLSPTLHPLAYLTWCGWGLCGGAGEVFLRKNEGPAHAGVCTAHQCLSTLSLRPHEQLARHLTELLAHTHQLPLLIFFQLGLKYQIDRQILPLNSFCVLGGGIQLRVTHEKTN